MGRMGGNCWFVYVDVLHVPGRNMHSVGVIDDTDIGGGNGVVIA